MKKRSKEEIFNTLTHFAGVIITLGIAWIIIWLGYSAGWKHAFGVTFFTVGMLLMFSFSTLYHWWPEGKGKRVLRILDHISIYVMIAASYTPICIGVVGGALGWTVFGLLWAVVGGGIAYKIAAINRYPKLSLTLYLIMGWSIIFIAHPVLQKLTALPLLFILLEGLFYTSGTYFFARDEKHRGYHGIWHLFVLAGAVAHWAAVLTILMES